jgi:hypothetical protein
MKTLLLTVVACSLFANSSLAADVLKPDQIKSLRGLKEIYLVYRPGDTRITNFQELVDHISLSLRRKVPELREKKDADAWMEISYSETELGAYVAIYVHQWAKLQRSDERLFVATWHSYKSTFGKMDADGIKQHLRSMSDDILTSFAADYYRANP